MIEGVLPDAVINAAFSMRFKNGFQLFDSVFIPAAEHIHQLQSIKGSNEEEGSGIDGVILGVEQAAICVALHGQNAVNIGGVEVFRTGAAFAGALL